jgi:hypothetical protein
VHLVSRRAHLATPSLLSCQEARFVVAAILRAAHDHGAGHVSSAAPVTRGPVPRPLADVRRPSSGPRRDGPARFPQGVAPRDRSATQICTLFIVVGVGVASGGAWWGARSAALARRATVATGTVVDYARSPFQSGEFPVVRYRLPSGVERVFRNGAGGTSQGYALGQQVEVLRDPENREPDRIRSFGDVWGAPILLLGLGLFFASGGVAFLRVFR